MPTCRGVRTNKRWAMPLVIALILSMAIGPNGLRVQAQTPVVGAGFTLDANDLRFIYQQILIAQAHAAPGGTINLSDPRLPFGLRTVDGSFNHLVAGQTNRGSSGVLFPRATTRVHRGAEALLFDPDGPGPQAAGEVTSYTQKKGAVSDSTPRLISNLIVDQTATNPAAVLVAGPDAVPDSSGTLFIPQLAPDGGLSAPLNTMFVFFGQFFDHGLDLIDRGNQPVFMPLRADDPLIPGPDGELGTADDLPINQRFMVIIRGENQPGPDGVVGDDPATPQDESLDDVQELQNRTTSFVDQNQTYTSNPSHQVFLREYEMRVDPATGTVKPYATGRFLDGTDANGVHNGNIGTWADVKREAATKLGIQLVDSDVLDIPMLATDPYGRFLRGPNGFAQLVMLDGTLMEGNPAAPISTAGSRKIGHAFLDDIAHNAVPDGVRGIDYDGELLDAHFCSGDGRGNENIALTAVHTVFHAEHNRLANQIGGVDGVGGLIDTLLTAEEAAAWRAVDPASGWDYGERVFQAARFVTEMQYQHLVFEEFARTVSPSINEFIGDGINFTSHLDPSITAEFAHAVYRFGHSMLTETISRTLPDGTQVDIPLLEGFLNPRAFNQVGTQTLTAAEAAGAIFQGGIRQVANEIDEFKTEALRNNLLGLPLDLAAINIARGRSEGVAPLNVVRQQLFDATADFNVEPYESWADFGFSMRYPESLANFVAAYGTHASITAETTIAGRRAAAQALVDAGDPWLFGPAAETGLNDVDFWMGGLAERSSPFGGVLGSTFNFIFEHQLEALQNADRFYYLERLDGLNLLAQLEGNSFAELISRNTTATGMAQVVFTRPDLVFNIANIDGGFDAETNSFLIVDDPTTPDDESAMSDLVRLPNGAFRYLGPAHVIWNGTANGDRATSSEGDDTFNGGDGSDRFEGGAGNDTPVGGLGDDVLTDVFGDDVIKGGPGNDAISGGSGPFDLLQGNEGDDFIVGGNDVSEIFGGGGDDVFYAGVGVTEVFGGAGDDWMEGTDSPASVLVGDENNQFQNDPSGGHDVMIAGPGDADFDAEGGDDIMVANVTPTHRLEGMLGYDFATYAGETTAVDADMLITGATEVNAPLNEVRDRYDLTEGLSGTNFNDLLRGDDRAEADLRDDGLTGVLNGHVLTTQGIARIRGLADLLPAGATEVAGGNIILGGPGSDLLEGRGGNDILDGDAWLNVELVGTLNDGTVVRGDRHSDLRSHVFSDPQRLNPGNIDIDRFIVTGDANAADVDVAVFSGPRADYTISGNEDGTFSVAHQGGTGLDGTDRVRNVEVLRFTDMDVSTVGEAGGLSVPNLFGMTETDARTTIVALGLNVGTVDPNGVHPTAAIGSVVQQDPVAGAGIAVGGTVNFTLTRGALVPDIHESTVTAGTATLEAGGFVVGGTTDVNDPEIPAGLVASTFPVAGEIIAPGSSVIINVSLGPAAAGVVPAVAGLPREDAEEAILNAGFTPAAVARFETSATIPLGGVTRTIPVAGTALAAGSTVTPVISTGTEGLVLALGFDEASGTVAIDSSIVARNGTLRQATMTRAAGRFGSAVVFDGVNDWVTVTDTTASPLDLRNRMTIEAWVNPTSLSGWETVVMKERQDGLAYALYANDGGTEPDGVSAPGAYNRIGIEDRRLSGTSAIPLNTWTHLAFTYDGANQRLYVNGELVQTRPQTGLNIQNNAALRIGGNAQWLTEFFNGMIDEVRIYQTVRTQEQIQADMNRPINP